MSVWSPWAGPLLAPLPLLALKVLLTTTQIYQPEEYIKNSLRLSAVRRSVIYKAPVIFQSTWLFILNRSCLFKNLKTNLINSYLGSPLFVVINMSNSVDLKAVRLQGTTLGKGFLTKSTLVWSDTCKNLL